MPRLTRTEHDQIELLLQAAIDDYPVPEEHYAYVSTLMTHVQADFSQALDYWSTELRPGDVQSSWVAIIAEVLRHQNPFEESREDRALDILRALPVIWKLPEHREGCGHIPTAGITVRRPMRDIEPD